MDTCTSSITQRSNQNIPLTHLIIHLSNFMKNYSMHIVTCYVFKKMASRENSLYPYWWNCGICGCCAKHFLSEHLSCTLKTSSQFCSVWDMFTVYILLLIFRLPAALNSVRNFGRRGHSSVVEQLIAAQQVSGSNPLGPYFFSYLQTHFNNLFVRASHQQ